MKLTLYYMADQPPTLVAPTAIITHAAAPRRYIRDEYLLRST